MNVANAPAIGADPAEPQEEDPLQGDGGDENPRRRAMSVGEATYQPGKNTEVVFGSPRRGFTVSYEGLCEELVAKVMEIKGKLNYVCMELAEILLPGGGPKDEEGEADYTVDIIIELLLSRTDNTIAGLKNDKELFQKTIQTLDELLNDSEEQKLKLRDLLAKYAADLAGTEIGSLNGEIASLQEELRQLKAELEEKKQLKSELAEAKQSKEPTEEEDVKPAAKSSETPTSSSGSSKKRSTSDSPKENDDENTSAKMSKVEKSG